MSLLSTHLSYAARVNDPLDITSTFYTSCICSSVSLNQTFSSSQFWIVDSGAFRHICSHTHVFTTLNPIQNSSVTHTTILVHYSGDIILNPDLTLKEVLFVPQFHFNLISISGFTNAIHLMLDFFPNYFIIQEIHSKRMIDKGKKLERLYVLNNKNLYSTAHVNTVSVSVQSCHNRLSHLSSNCLDKLKDQLHYTTSKFPTNSPCYIFPLAKQRQLSFASHNNIPSSPFDLIHCDIWGPHLPDYSGHRYFLTLVDDCTRFTWLFLLKHKSNVSHVIPKIFKLISTQFDMKIKAFRFDNAKELLFTNFFAEMGFIHQFSCVEQL